METQKTRLQKIKEQLEEKLARAIVETIKSGAKTERSHAGITIDGVFVIGENADEAKSVVLKIKAPEINELFEPTEEQMQKRAEALRAELTEIENRLNSK